jgi:hypothetical protein
VFNATPTTYHDKTNFDGGNAARNHPMGFSSGLSTRSQVIARESLYNWRMPEFVGVAPFTVFGLDDLKRELLVFDKILVPGLKTTLIPSLTADDVAEQRSELEWLLEQNLIGEAFTVVDSRTIPTLMALADRVREYPYLFTRLVASSLRTDHRVDAVALESEEDLAQRHISCQMTAGSMYRINATCLPLGRSRTPRLDRRLNADFFDRATRIEEAESPRNATPALEEGTILDVIIKEFPRPDTQTSWEDIIAFRSDPDVIASRADLRMWAFDLATAKASPLDVARKLDHLRSQYSRYMRVHKLKASRSTIRATVVAIAEVASEFAKMNWGKLAERFFEVREGRAALLDDELNAPGREVAYIIKCRERFAPN